MTNGSLARADADAARAASATAFALIAYQVAGRAVRDALFLSHFDASFLPRMFVASAVVAIAAIVLFARPLARRGPQRMASRVLFASAGIQILLYFLARTSPKTAAIALYLHLAIAGTVLISWFWAAVTERFDPFSAKRRIGTITVAATLGGIAGGVLAERVGTAFSTITLLPVLGVFHALAGVFARRIGTSAQLSSRAPHPETDPADVRTVAGLLREPYLKALAALVAGVAVSSVFVDFVFKTRAQAAFTGTEDLLRFFALFYAAASILTFTVQFLVTRPLLLRVGLANTAATLPLATAGFGLAAILAPGLATVTAVRAVESILRSSVFRSSYELFYTPVALRVVRAAKSVVDVGFDRLGEGLGALVIHGVLVAGIAAPQALLLSLSVAVAVGCLLLTPRLHQGYVATLERSLIDGGAGIDPESAADETTRSTILRTLSGVTSRHTITPASTHGRAGAGVSTAHSRATAGASASGVVVSAHPADPVVARIQELRSGDTIRVRKALAASDSLDAAVVPHAIVLLAWDAVASDAARALAKGADRWTGQLVDALVDPASEFAVRRRIPRVLARATTERAVSGLVRGLEDSRFEVRVRCSEALASLRTREPDLPLDAARVWTAIEREAKAGAGHLAGQRILDTEEGDSTTSRAAARALLSLLNALHPRAQFAAAFDCLRGDVRTRGTALEYVETFLPAALRRDVMALLEETSTRASAEEATRAVLTPDPETLTRSQETIRTSLEEIRKVRGESSV